MRHVESNIQISCVRWFRYQYSSLSRLLISVPNGGKRDARTGAILKREGVVAGVSDLILLIPNKKYHGLCIEIKTEKGRQQVSQKQWEATVKDQGYKYVICRSCESFIYEVTNYMNNT